VILFLKTQQELLSRQSGRGRNSLPFLINAASGSEFRLQAASGVLSPTAFRRNSKQELEKDAPVQLVMAVNRGGGQASVPAVEPWLPARRRGLRMVWKPGWKLQIV